MGTGGGGKKRGGRGRGTPSFLLLSRPVKIAGKSSLKRRAITAEGGKAGIRNSYSPSSQQKLVVAQLHKRG